MDARSAPGVNDPFEEAIDDALNSLPADLHAAMSNVEIVVEDEPPRSAWRGRPACDPPSGENLYQQRDVRPY